MKEKPELDAIRRAARIADEAFATLLEEPWVGRTERELSWRLSDLMRERGADGLAFPPVVAAGPHGALPHHDPGDVPIDAGTIVVVDWGASVDGYKSDCTRTVATGDLPEELQRAYDVCLAAQQTAVAGLRAGLGGVDADRLARDPIDAAGFGDAFGHGLGHGVGLLVHEAPRLSPESHDHLATGHVVTVEPGIYLAGLGGVRIEDLAVVRDDGLELLTSLPKELRRVS